MERARLVRCLKTSVSDWFEMMPVWRLEQKNHGQQCDGCFDSVRSHRQGLWLCECQRPGVGNLKCNLTNLVVQDVFVLVAKIKKRKEGRSERVWT